MAQTRLNAALGIMVLLPILLFIWVVLTYQPPLTQLSWNWVPSLDINLMFRLDGLSVLFAGLITGIGVLVQLYSLAYMKGKPARFSFHLLLTLFMLSMLGLVLADNILLLFVFWELTTLTSYFLIGYNHEEAKSRKNALQAMLITGMGGLTLLAGLLMLGNLADSYQLSLIIERAPGYQDSVWFIPSLLCVLAGAFTKSAQFPFHFWLPGAMAAPTPVSAYLHSATMVKAGVYLLARLLPVYGETALWGWSLGIAGAATGLWCGLLALRQTDLKLMLAYSTNVVLGKLVLLLGIGTETAVSAALLLITAHAFYKAGLFMVIGIIDKATGTREYGQLAALKPVLGISFLAAVVGSAPKAGFPPTLGFLSKEYMYKAGIYSDVVTTVAMVAINILLVTLALVLVIKPFLGKKHDASAEIKPVEQYKLLWMPPLLLT
ncbi:MAG: proton-conducting transporter membrane subunit, partial [Pseudohongiellaceae bacterium]